MSSVETRPVALLEQREGARFKLRDLLPEDLLAGISEEQRDLFIDVPDFAFKPDQWTIAFLRGLKKENFTNKTVWEIGSGVGLNLIMLKLWNERTQFLSSDLDPRATDTTVNNLENTFSLNEINCLLGPWNLTEHDEKWNDYWEKTSSETKGKIDCIVACIPQVPKPENVDLDKGDAKAHYFDPKEHNVETTIAGLSLNTTLLEKAKSILSEKGEVILNLGGRPGKKVLLKMFIDRGYTPEIIHEEVIAQHGGTSLEALIEHEKKGNYNYEFFSDSDCFEQINAKQAEEKRVKGETVYHKIYVIKGILNS